MAKIGMGDLAKDRITNFEGVIVNHAIWLHGCDKFALRSKELKDGNPADDEWFDDSQIEVIKKSVISFVNKQVILTTINLGDKVKDKLSGIEGIVVAASIHTDNPLNYGIQSQKLEKGTPTKIIWISHNQTVLIKKDPLKLTVVEEQPKKTKRPGGPRQDPRF